MLGDGYHDVPPGKLAMVVTHLEMRAKPDLREAPLPRGVTLHRVTPTLAWYRDIFRRVGADWLWFGRLTLDDETLCAILDDPDVSVYTLSRDGRDEAILELDHRQPGACELAYFGLTKPLIGTGAGRALMNTAIEHAYARPITRFHVHTCTIDSPQAVDFYIRSGFLPYRRQVEIADDPRLINLYPKDCAPYVPII